MIKKMSKVIQDLRAVSQIKVDECDNLRKEYGQYREAVEREKQENMKVENLKMRQQSTQKLLEATYQEELSKYLKVNTIYNELKTSDKFATEKKVDELQYKLKTCLAENEDLRKEIMLLRNQNIQMGLRAQDKEYQENEKKKLEMKIKEQES